MAVTRTKLDPDSSREVGIHSCRFGWAVSDVERVSQMEETISRNRTSDPARPPGSILESVPNARYEP